MKRYKHMDISTKIIIGHNGSEFGPGTIRLLKEIDRCGSVRHAAEAMEVSYGKTWKMIRDIEDALKEPVVERQQGGPRGGSARITEAGYDLIRCYDLLAADIKEYAKKRFEEEFK